MAAARDRVSTADPVTLIASRVIASLGLVLFCYSTGHVMWSMEMVWSMEPREPIIIPREFWRTAVTYVLLLLPSVAALVTIAERWRLAAGCRLLHQGARRVGYLELTVVGVRAVGLFYLLLGIAATSHALAIWLQPPHTVGWWFHLSEEREVRAILQGSFRLGVGLILVLPGRALVVFVQKASRV